ncbi:MAG: adenosylhomocysteinase [Actinomycetota bacterium]|nr:adenosylhomocysteinase [Actinomycetota bacterium]
MTSTGRGMIEFARQFMPALASARETVAGDDRLRGRRVGIALTLEPKTACLVEAVASLGAEVSVFGSGHSTKGEVAAALAETGIQVFAEEGADRDRVSELREAFIDTRPEFLSDDGASIVRRIHSERRDVLESLRGVAEETTSGVRPLRVMEAEGALMVPCIAVNDARVKLLFDNVYGTGQSVVMAVLDATNMQMSGSAVVVVGYGMVGRGIAGVARGLGARVTVTEIDAVEALAAHHDGFRVSPLAEAVTEADFVITATGIGHTLTAEHVSLMRDGTVVAVGGAGPPEFDASIGPAVEWGPEVRPKVRPLSTGSGSTVFVVADGHCANTSAGEGNPIEVMDLSLALQLRALDVLATEELGPGVHLLPRHIEDEVAASQLAAAGIEIDQPTEAQIRAATTW